MGRPVERRITRLGQPGREFNRRVPMSLASPGTKVYGDAMSFTLWLSAEEERILAKIMRHEGSRSKEQAVIKAIRDKADLLAADRPTRETPESADRTHTV